MAVPSNGRQNVPGLIQSLFVTTGWPVCMCSWDWEAHMLPGQRLLPGSWLLLAFTLLLF